MTAVAFLNDETYVGEEAIDRTSLCCARTQSARHERG